MSDAVLIWAWSALGSKVDLGSVWVKAAEFYSRHGLRGRCGWCGARRGGDATLGRLVMNVVFLSPHFPPNWFRFAVGLREAGANPLGIADVPRESLRHELRDALGDHYRVDDLANYDQLTRALSWFIERHGHIDRLDSLNEHWLEIEAALRSDFNIPGIDRQAIGPIKRKSLMKDRLTAGGIPVARGHVYQDPDALRSWLAEIGTPAVAKPDVGVGAAHTFKLESESDVAGFVAHKPDLDFIVEEFVDGELLTYDGLTDASGEVVFDSTLTYSSGVMEALNEQLDLSYWIPRQFPMTCATWAAEWCARSTSASGHSISSCSGSPMAR